MNLARQHFRKHQAKSAAEQAAEFGSMKKCNGIRAATYAAQQ